jgi:hypothetical protein
MENFGKQRGFDEKFASRVCSHDRRAPVKGAPIKPQPSLLDEINRLNLVALPKQQLISPERPSLKLGFVQQEHQGMAKQFTTDLPISRVPKAHIQ